MARRVVKTPQQMKGKSLTVSLLMKEGLSETKTKKEDETKRKPETEPDLESEESITLEFAGTPEIDRSKMDDAASGVTNLNDVSD